MVFAQMRVEGTPSLRFRRMILTWFSERQKHWDCILQEERDVETRLDREIKEPNNRRLDCMLNQNWPFADTKLVMSALYHNIVGKTVPKYRNGGTGSSLLP